MTDRGSPAARVWAVVLNYNGWADTLECLESVARTEHATLRVIVVDNASTNQSVERIVDWANGAASPPAQDTSGVRPASPPVPKPVSFRVLDAAGGVEAENTAGEPWLTIMRSPRNLGFAGGNNIALRHLLEQEEDGLVWLLNNDVVVAPTTLSRMIARAGEPGAGAIGATMLEYHMPSVVQAAGGGTYGRWNGLVHVSQMGASRGMTHEQEPLDYVSGGCVLVPLHVIRAAGLLDERFFLYAEDIDWCIRIRAAGFGIRYARDAEVWHKGSASSVAGSPFNDFHNVRSSLLLVHKYTPLRLPVAAVLVGYRCVVPKILRGQWPRLAAVRRAYADVARVARSGRHAWS